MGKYVDLNSTPGSHHRSLNEPPNHLSLPLFFRSVSQFPNIPYCNVVQDYMQNVHGKEIDLLRTTVKIPGKRPPRAVATVAPTASPKTNGLTKDRSGLQLGIGNAGVTSRPLVDQRQKAKAKVASDW